MSLHKFSPGILNTFASLGSFVSHPWINGYSNWLVILQTDWVVMEPLPWVFNLEMASSQACNTGNNIAISAHEILF